MSDQNNAGHQERLGQFLQALLSRTPAAAARLEGTLTFEGRAPPRPAYERSEVEQRAEALLQRSASPRDVDTAEAIILPDLRPVLDVQDSTFPDPGPYFPELEDDPTPVIAALPAVGRIDVAGIPGLPYAGTGFLVGNGVLMTNRHVAELFTSGLGSAGRLRFVPGVEPSLDLRHELDRAQETILTIVKPLLIHPHWDMALFQVKGSELPPALSLAASEPVAAVLPAAAVGYPAFDPRNDRQVQMKVFRGHFGVKRVQPGYTTGRLQTSSFGHSVRALGHDCSTLGGNSGSCVLDVVTGKVLGLHFGGAYLDSNYAVPAWELARDEHVVRAGVHFAGKRGRGPAEWDVAWRDLDQEPEPLQASSKRKPRKKTESPTEWYERTDADGLRAQWLHNQAECFERLEQAAGPMDAWTARVRLSEGRSERLFARRVDSDALEIIYLHGIMGAHLDTPDGRSWLNLERLMLGDLAGRLALKPDGVTDAWTGPPATPGPHLKVIYQRAADAWRDEGLVVRPFSYDWRRPVEVEAERLAGFIATLRRERPGRKQLLVAHSMGGLVAATWAAAHPDDWRDTIERVALLGSPLGGSFAPFEAILGTYPLFRKLAKLSMRDSLGDLQGMARSLSGLVDMLPDPTLFPDAEPLYTASAWQSPFAPDPAQLDRSRRLKKTLATSPLLERAVALVSIGHGTISQLANGKPGPRTGPGDGTVPIDSAAPKGVKAFVVEKSHSNLPRDALAISAVLQLARGQLPALQELTEAQRRAPPLQAEAIVQELSVYDELRLPDVRAHLADGQLDGSDLDWILSSGSDVLDRQVERGGVACGAVGLLASHGGETGPSLATEGPAFREYQVGGPLGIGDPVHETITLTALTATKHPAANNDQVIRGVFWNDDPECLLFDDGATSRPLAKSTGFLFGLRFKRLELFISGKRPITPADGLMARSHFGDLQFLHAMASTADELPGQTLKAMLEWAEFCWSLATGAILPTSKPDEWGPLATRFESQEGHIADAANLFSCPAALVPLRAFGSLCHMIEDSYAGGHAEREPIDRTRRGRILQFFCYTNQDHAKHAELDRWQGGKTTADHLAGLPGALDAMERVQELSRRYQAQAAWKEVKAWLEQGPWKLAKTGTESRPKRRPKPTVSGPRRKRRDARKVSNKEGGAKRNVG